MNRMRNWQCNFLIDNYLSAREKKIIYINSSVNYYFSHVNQPISYKIGYIDQGSKIISKSVSLITVKKQQWNSLFYSWLLDLSWIKVYLFEFIIFLFDLYLLEWFHFWSSKKSNFQFHFVRSGTSSQICTKANEVYQSCSNGPGCQTTCKNFEDPPICIQSCSTQFAGCYCRAPYVRSDLGECVPTSQCKSKSKFFFCQFLRLLKFFLSFKIFYFSRRTTTALL